MDRNRAIEVLERHNKWRRGDDELPQTDPKELTEAIDCVCAALKAQGEPVWWLLEVDMGWPEPLLRITRSEAEAIAIHESYPAGTLATVTPLYTAPQPESQAVPDEGKLWSWLRGVVRHGGTLIHEYRGDQSYEASLDVIASEYVEELRSMLATPAPEPQPDIVGDLQFLLRRVVRSARKHGDCASICQAAMEYLEKIGGNGSPLRDSQAVPDGWQPIESAPKSTRSILVHCAEYGNTYVVTWREDVEESGWLHFGGCFDRLTETPTHWMPQPAAPAQGGQV